MSQTAFLSAAWKRLIMANYTVDPALLLPYVPAGTELDEWNDKCYVSLVGFLFDKVRVKGFAVPFHTRFPEVNLRFYVKYKGAAGHQPRRGVVFISEIVPLPAISFVANSVFGEHYSTRKMNYLWMEENKQLRVRYSWRNISSWYYMETLAQKEPLVMQAGSEAEFITEHYWGYSAISAHKTGEYEVIHPRWKIHPVISHTICCDFEKQYGKAFGCLSQADPASVFLAEGSPVAIMNKRIISP